MPSPTPDRFDWRPSASWVRRSGLALVLLPLLFVSNPISRLAGLDDASPRSYLPVAMLLVVGVAAATGLVLARRVAPPATTLAAPLLAVAGVLVMAAAVAIAHHNSPFLVVDDAFQIAELLMAFWVIAVFVRSRRDMLFIISFLGVMIVADILVDFATSGVWEALRGHASFLRIEPYGIRVLPGLALPVGVAALATARGRKRWMMGAAVALLFVWTAMSLTRGLWVGVAAALLAMLLVATPDLRRRLLAVFGLGLLAAVLIAVPVIAAVHAVDSHFFDYAVFRVTFTPQQLFAPVGPIQARRQVESAAVIQEILRSPVLGAGLGAEYIGPTGDRLANYYIGPRHFIHDSYLAIWFRMGIGGLIAIVWLAGKYLVVAARRHRTSGDWMPLGLACSYLAILVYSVTADSVFRHPMDLFAALALVGSTLSAGTGRSRSRMEPKVRSRDIAITVISHSHRGLLERCLLTAEASLAESGLDGMVLVLDNASTDGSADLVRERFPRVHLLAMRESHGFSSNQNQLLTEAGSSFRYLLLLNDDVELPADAIGRLVEAADADPGTGALAPRLVYPNGQFQTAGERLPSIAYHLIRHLGIGRAVPSALRRRLGSRRAAPAASTMDAGYVAAACLLIRQDCLDSVGQFDERFQLYSEDADWCKRAWEQGWRISVLPSLAVTHHRNQSWSSFAARERERSMYLYLKKHGTGAFRLAILRLVVLVSYTARLVMLRLLIACHLRRRDAVAVETLRAYYDILHVTLQA